MKKRRIETKTTESTNLGTTNRPPFSRGAVCVHSVLHVEAERTDSTNTEKKREKKEESVSQNRGVFLARFEHS